MALDSRAAQRSGLSVCRHGGSADTESLASRLRRLAWLSGAGPLASHATTPSSLDLGRRLPRAARGPNSFRAIQPNIPCRCFGRELEGPRPGDPPATDSRLRSLNGRNQHA